MSAHISSIKLYFSIFLALMLGTALTVAAAYVDMGALNNVVAMGIAIAKATLVVLFFMHVRYSSRLTSMIVVSAVLFLLILFPRLALCEMAGQFPIDKVSINATTLLFTYADASTEQWTANGNCRFGGSDGADVVVSPAGVIAGLGGTGPGSSSRIPGFSTGWRLATQGSIS